MEEGSAAQQFLPEEAGQEEAQQPSLLDIYNYSRDQLAALIAERFGENSYRADQLYEWLYKRHVRDFSQMTNISRGLRTELEKAFAFEHPKWRERQISTDGTRKYLFCVSEDRFVESVMIKQPKRMTLCVSSQVGCGMGCKFCRTATMGFRKNLTTSEIVRQVLGVIEDAKNFGDEFSNIVFMGMGEPLHNFDGVTTALKILVDQKGLGIAPRKITISSVGLVPAIEKFGTTGIDVNIAISLNATNNEVRGKIMPINKAFPIERLLACLRAYPLKPRRKFTIEYVMLAGVNDRAEDLKRLPGLLHGIPAKINLIPYNENAGLGFFTPSRENLNLWQDRLMRAGFDTTIRWSKGQDIKAACGQLAVEQVAAVVQ